jgi:hypothetical protein
VVPTLLRASALALVALALTGCSTDKGALLAPSDAQISLTPSAPLVTINGSVPVTVKVALSDGSPAGDGTEVLLSASRGQFESPKVRTRNGQATAAYQAAPDSGPVELYASSDVAEGRTVLAIASAPVSRISIESDKSAVAHGGGSVELTATVFSEGGARVASAPVLFVSTSGSFSPATPVLTNDQGEAVATLTTAQAASARARVHVIESSALNVAVEAAIGLQVVATPGSATVGQPVKFTITPTDLKRVGTMTLTYGDSQVQDLGEGSGVRSVFYTYSTAGGYNVTAAFRSRAGTEVRETIRLNVAGIAPQPPPGSSGGGSIDEDIPFSLSDVTWLHADVSGWAVTSQVTDITIDSDTICIYHTKSGRWPVVGGGEGNPWVFAKIGGKWYAATYEYLRPGQTCKHIERSGEWGIGPHTKREPLESWVPRKGELVGFMVSTFARDSTRTSNERSNIVMVNWPY